jgi:hypothetical protein
LIEVFDGGIMSENGSENSEMVKWANVIMIAPADPAQSKTGVNSKKKKRKEVYLGD